MWYLEHCSAATIPSFSLPSEVIAEEVIAEDCFQIENMGAVVESGKAPILVASFSGICNRLLKIQILLKVIH